MNNDDGRFFCSRYTFVSMLAESSADKPGIKNSSAADLFYWLRN